MAQWIEERRDKPRQAVILIQGIGEQQPGEILRGFREIGVLRNRDKANTWIKPDRLSVSIELRRGTLARSGNQPLAEIYECYWAHIVQDTTLEQVISWSAWILLRKKNPPKLFPLWLLVLVYPSSCYF